ncbi:unnamed protein product [Caenorhabditis angaria]|uniref:Uncharacterized protein n=1 Tax=Caenorhabditis angaria TaxID=860376 RepID=A0A9P1MXC7_9PELO|nr:unnamed protein product [Caenorhabditis angaria]
MRIFSWIFLVSQFLAQVLVALIDESSCPSGWQVASDVCVKIVIPPATLQQATKFCHAEGGQLLDTSSNLLLEDVFEILKNLYEIGLTEPIFYISGEGQALNRTENGKYVVVNEDANSEFPSICSLNKMERRSLLFQQKLLQKGAPRLSPSGLQSEIYFHPRNDADYIALPCIVEANPKPTISWFRNDIEVVSPSSSNVSYLLSGGNLLVPASSSLAYSTFHCTARNALGEVRSPPIILKPSFIDAFRQHRLDVYSFLIGGAKLDCDAPPHQPKSLTYNWLIGDSTNRLVAQSERKFISLDGTLFLSYVVKEDEESYACSLSVYATQSGHYGPFFKLITATANSSLEFPPRLDSTQPQLFPDQPKIGDSIYLECFAYGNPIPQYKWHRFCESKKATQSDAGKYKCTATNSLGVAAGEVSVKLRQPPIILQPLYDRIVAIGSSVDFECLLSSADSSSDVEWFKDSTPIVPLLLPPEDRKKFKIIGNVLKISGADEKNSGVYQCIVSNEIGSSTSSALLSVRDSAPIFPPNAMPRRLFAAVGSTVRIPCIFEASPRTHGHWADAGGARLPKLGRLRDIEGVMTIEKVLHDDSGLFFCTAHNRMGKAHAQVQLIVMDKPSIRTNAASSNFIDEETVNMSCEVELSCENSSECPEALFEWRINDRPSSEFPLLRPKLHSTQHKGRHIKQKVDLEVPKSMGGKHIGRFACSSLYGGSSEIVTRPQLPSPIALTIEEISETRGTKMRLRWRLPPQHRDTRDHSTKIDGYIVELRTKKNRKWRSVDRQTLSEIEKDSILLSNLRPNTEYQFRVRSVDTSTIGEPSIPTEWIRTPPGAPYEIVENLKWRPLDAQTLLVEWQPIEVAGKSGDNLRYRVSWSEANLSNASTTEEVQEKDKNFLDSDQPQAILKLSSNSSGCRMVVLAVKPVNDQGSGAVSTDTIAFLNSRGELKKVEMQNVRPVNATHVNISWIWDEKTAECETKHGVQISCMDVKSSPDRNIIATAGSEKLEWMLGGLTAETAYDCELRAVDNHGNMGPASRKFRIHTKQQPPVEVPGIRKLMMKQMKEDYTTILEWSQIELQKPNRTEIGCGYKIFIYISETGSEPIILDMPVHRLSDRQNPSARLDGLRLMYLYTVQVAGYNPGGIGPKSESKTIRLGAPNSVEYTSASLNFFCKMKPQVFFGHLLTARFDHRGNIHVLSRAEHNVHVSILSPISNGNYRFASVTKKSSF